MHVFILGHGGGRKEGVENGPAGRGGFGFFLQGGEGYCKTAKRALQIHFLMEFLKLVKNMRNFAVLRHYFLRFLLAVWRKSFL